MFRSIYAFRWFSTAFTVIVVAFFPFSPRSLDLIDVKNSVRSELATANGDVKKIKLLHSGKNRKLNIANVWLETEWLRRTCKPSYVTRIQRKPLTCCRCSTATDGNSNQSYFLARTTSKPHNVNDEMFMNRTSSHNSYWNRNLEVLSSKYLLKEVL